MEIHAGSRWDKRFISLARHIAEWSKDPSTQCGAVIVRQDKTIASIGFNGLPMGVPDDWAVLNDREEKLDRIVHSEMNALLFLRESVKHAGVTLYVWPMPPCIRCMAHIVQAGIRDVASPMCMTDRWQESTAKAVSMMRSAGGDVRYIDTPPYMMDDPSHAMQGETS
jgi:dCMP deaminase